MAKTVWDLTSLYKNDNDPKMQQDRAVIEKEQQKFIKKWQKTQSYLKNPQVLKQALDDYAFFYEKYAWGGDEGYYFELKTQLDQNDASLKAKYQKIDDFATDSRNRLQFFELNIAKIDPKLQKKFLADKKLAPYKHFLERLFIEAKYLLPDEQEKIMNLKSATSYQQWVKMTSGFLAKEEMEVLDKDGKKKVLSFEEVYSLVSHPNKKIRDKAAQSLNKVFEKYIAVGEAEMNAILGNKKVDDELRGFKRPDQSRHISDDIETEIVDTVLEAVSARYDIAKRFYQLKAKLLGLPKLEYHERNIEYGEAEKDYSFDDSVKLVGKVFEKIDPLFAQFFHQFLQNGQVDVFPRKGKRGGAACWHNLISQPSYILLNHGNKLRDVTTIAHEYGHGINNELMRKAQNSLNFSTPTSTAEIASTFMEDFVLEEIMSEANDELRLSIMMMKLNDDVSAIFRQVACYKFEQELHQTYREKGYLSFQEIGEIFKKHMESYMGKAVEQSPGSENWWLFWWHIRTFFYVYSYASGLLISKSMQSSVREDPQFIEKVKYFLSAGRSQSPKEIFKSIGIDMTKREFWDKGLDEVESLLKDTEKLAKKLKKL